MTWPNFSVSVVDNGSTDGSQDFVRRKYPKVELIEIGANLGFSRALNLAISKSKAPFVCSLNNDIEVTPNWLNVLVKDFRDTKVAVSVPKMYDFLGRFNSAGGACDLYSWAYNRVTGEIDRGQHAESCYGPYGRLGICELGV
jgi:hypothetical protein